jgi:hypothetical protein
MDASRGDWAAEQSLTNQRVDGDYKLSNRRNANWKKLLLADVLVGPLLYLLRREKPRARASAGMTA